MANRIGKIFHIAQDEKFINSAYKQFEKVAPSQNQFYILVGKEPRELNHVSYAENIHILLKNKETIKKLVAEITDRDIVIFHSLSQRFYDIVLALPNSIVTVWFCFGYEIYSDPRFVSPKKNLAAKTYKKFSHQIKSRSKKIKVIKEYVRPYYRIIKTDLPLSAFEIKKKAVRRIDYLGSSFLEEFEFICRRINSKKRFFSFWYYPIEQIIDTQLKMDGTKKNLWVGNSGYMAGNHLDVFELLKHKDITGFEEIIVPLSYGTDDYIAAIEKEGRIIFGDKFKPLLDFMSLSAYNDYLKTTAVAIFYNKRQQALGNIIALLWMGSKVFLSSKNPFYRYLGRKGLIIFSVEKDIHKKNALFPLSIEEQKVNRHLLNNLLGENKLLKELRQQLALINRD